MKTKILMIGLLTLASITVQAQLSASYYDGNPASKIGVGYDFNETIWSEIRMYTGSDISNFTFEGVVNFNLKQTEDYKFYIGAGAVLNDLTGLVAPIGLQISPFKNFREFAFQIEAMPMYEFDASDAFFFGSWGIRYRFPLKKSKD